MNTVSFIAFSLLCSSALSHATTLTASKDADVYQYTGSSTGTYFSLNVTPSEAHALKSIIQFNVTEATVGYGSDHVESAILRLHVLAPSGSFESFTAGQLNVYYQTQSWNEASVTWNSFLEGALITAFNATAHSTAASPVTIDIDITTAVKAWLDGSVTNHGIIIRTPTTSTGASTAFASREFDIIPELSAFDPNATGPQLIITQAEPDSDNDGYTDAQENEWGSDANNPDAIPVKLEMSGSALTYNTWSGHSYQLQYSLNLSDWFPLGPVIEGNDSELVFPIDFEARDANAEFYRVQDITNMP